MASSTAQKWAQNRNMAKGQLMSIRSLLNYVVFHGHLVEKEKEEIIEIRRRLGIVLRRRNYENDQSRKEAIENGKVDA